MTFRLALSSESASRGAVPFVCMLFLSKMQFKEDARNDSTVTLALKLILMRWSRLFCSLSVSVGARTSQTRKLLNLSA
jgi:hypothetical protein